MPDRIDLVIHRLEEIVGEAELNLLCQGLEPLLIAAMIVDASRKFSTNVAALMVYSVLLHVNSDRIKTVS